MPDYGRLCLIATPIGNMEDITIRALRELESADMIAAEDTRVTSKLLSRYSIRTTLFSYNEHNYRKKMPGIISDLKKGLSVALVTDAGTPAIQDPGTELVARCHEEGIEIDIAPGPSSHIAALALSGIHCVPHHFEGFLPRKRTKRKGRLKELLRMGIAVVFFEAPHRLADTLCEMGEEKPYLEIAVVKEISKVHQRVIRGNPAKILKDLGSGGIRGEFVVIIPPVREKNPCFSRDEIAEEIAAFILEGLSPRDAVREAASLFCVSKKIAYDVYLKDVKPEIDGDL